jgi:hypothetical protein
MSTCGIDDYDLGRVNLSIDCQNSAVCNPTAASLLVKAIAIMLQCASLGWEYLSVSFGVGAHQFLSPKMVATESASQFTRERAFSRSDCTADHNNLHLRSSVEETILHSEIPAGVDIRSVISPQSLSSLLNFG